MLTLTPLHTINSSDCSDLAIRRKARDAGIAQIAVIAERGAGDARVTVYQVGDVLVAGTNGNPVWREDDPQGFDALLDDNGIVLA